MQYLVAAGIFVIIDYLWLTVIAGKLYKKELDGMLRKKPDIFAAVVFYMIYILGIVVFALSPALREESFLMALGLGGLLGLVMYATYDLTNLSTLKNWPRKITMIDLAWGTILTATVTALTYVIVS